MNNTIQTISILDLILILVPVIIVIVAMWKWHIQYKNSIYAVFRMLIQLLLVGYALNYIFSSKSSLIVVLVLVIMLISSGWIALRTVDIPKMNLFMSCFFAITLGGGSVLALVTQGVLRLEPWYLPNYMIPLAGMIFANAMNAISLAGERLQSELSRGTPYLKARTIAFQASLIPITNSLFAVGLVSLPGMMTGQILSGISPFIAARYQIMVMCMTFGAAGISSILFLVFTQKDFEQSNISEEIG